MTVSLGTKTSIRSFLNTDFSKLAAVFGLGMSSNSGFYDKYKNSNQVTGHVHTLTLYESITSKYFFSFPTLPGMRNILSVSSPSFNKYVIHSIATMYAGELAR